MKLQGLRFFFFLSEIKYFALSDETPFFISRVNTTVLRVNRKKRHLFLSLLFFISAGTARV